MQNLFFATLNTPMGKDITAENKDEQRRFINTLPKTGNDQYLDQTKYRYQNYFTKPDKALELFATIPFLNGGLFECLDFRVGNKEIRFDGFSSTEKRQAFVPDKLFFAAKHPLDLNAEYGTKNKKYEVEGLINILDDYKFTITENTPLEEEIALDPELLGKVFENLLASYNPETQTTARKQTGSFYTPREIVNYMVDESLIAYFKPKLDNTEETGNKLRDLFSHTIDLPEFSKSETDVFIKAISEVKILDPACGSGAFPMGVLHRLVDLLNKLDPDNKKWNELQKQRAIAETAEVFDSGDVSEREIRLNEINKAFDLSMNYPDYARKLFLIENCIYGVDIQQIAIQISKLRFFISLIVDQKVDDNKPNRNILSMPNLETKFVAANTLIGLDKPRQMALMAGDVEMFEKELGGIRHKIFFTRKYYAKKALKKKEKAKREELQIALTQSGFNKNVAGQMAGWNPFDPMKSAKFFDPETMFGFKDGFDVVIGNPPYIKEYTFKDAFEGVRTSPYYQGKMDLWYLFACKNLDNLRMKSGVLCFIATNNWTTNSGASKMRAKVLNDSTIHFLLDFGSYMIFESADIQTMVMLFRNDNSNDNYNFELRRLVGDKIVFDDVLNLVAKKQTEKTEYLIPKISKGKLKDKSFTFSKDVFENILDKIKARANFQLNENTEVAQGIVLPQDLLNKSNQKILGDKFRVGQGIFVLNDDEKEAFDFNKMEIELIKPYFTTNQIHRWYGDSENVEWIIYTDSKFKYAENIKPYPNIKKHLDKFQEIITSDNKPYGLHRSREESFFKDEKIIVLRKYVNEPIFTYTDFDCYVSATFYVIKSERINLKYLTAILNSKLIEFWLRNKGKMQGNNYQLDKEPLLQIPIFKTKVVKPITSIVDQILSAKAANPKADTRQLERQIDELVYGLYELTEEEIKIIEGK
nr:Eco57I restriction-modification methylase domain-containing protein [Bacteroidota bacterium]